jgi:hypothetical protein
LPEADVAALPVAISTLVAQTVEELVQFDIRTSGGIRTAPPYKALADVIQWLLKRGELVTLLTYNYDLGADFAVANIGRPIDYGLPGMQVGPTHVPLLKLHGSLGWTMRETDQKMEIVPISLQQLSQKVCMSTGQDHWQGPVRARDYLKGVNLTGRPVIVPPTWAKTAFYRDVQDVWRRAAKELKDAENIYVLGYSLPPTDEFFRILYALGTAGSARLKRFWVFNPDPAVEARFRGILGQAAETRFRFFPEIFSQGTRTLTGLLNMENVGIAAG